MIRSFCRCKIHHAIVTESQLTYVGSMTIPEDLMKKLDIREAEQVEVVNINNGERWTTYAIPGKKANEFCLNGAAARLGQVGDKLIIMVYCLLNEKEAQNHRIKIAFLDDQNRLARLQK